MPIPTYEEFMLPLLKITFDLEEHGYKEFLDILSEEFKLSDVEKEELLPSGTKTVLYDRISWATSYLKNAGLIESPKRGRFKITHRGMNILRKNPSNIDNKFLKQYPEFIEYLERTGKKSSNSDKNEDACMESQTPESLIESGFKEYSENLENDLLSEIKSMSDKFFEKLALDVVLSMGYGDKNHSFVTKQSRDGGTDGKILEDPLGFKDQIYIQAKKYTDNPITESKIRDFVGTLGDKVDKGIFITSSYFTKDAYAYIEKVPSKNIVLIDGKMLVKYMIEYNCGVEPVKSYALKRIDLSGYKNPEE